MIEVYHIVGILDREPTLHISLLIVTRCVKDQRYGDCFSGNRKESVTEMLSYDHYFISSFVPQMQRSSWGPMESIALSILSC